MERYVISMEEVEPLDTKGAKDFFRSSCKVLISKERMGAKGCMFRATFRPGGYHAKHLHTESDEFVYIISCGKAIKGIEDKVYEMRPGMCFFLPKGVSHWMKNLDEKENIEVVGVYPETGNLDETGYKFLGEIPERR